jgi:regulation of enolase protein 1 (concanavalin A-like superfamily)
MKLDFSIARWLNQPKSFEFSDLGVKIITDPGTDFWQRSYYGFRNDNAPGLLFESKENFTFTVKASFVYQGKYDQCGLIIYLDSDNWFKASVEYESEAFSRLGSVVTNLGYSDWATVDIPTPTSMWYRLSRRGPDFLIESSYDGRDFNQMRLFHLHKLGETTAEMGQIDPPMPAAQSIPFGLYACSPLQSSFEARFDNFLLEPCLWRAQK